MSQTDDFHFLDEIASPLDKRMVLEVKNPIWTSVAQPKASKLDRVNPLIIDKGFARECFQDYELQEGVVGFSFLPNHAISKKSSKPEKY